MVPGLPDHSRDALGLCLRDPLPYPGACPRGPVAAGGRAGSPSARMAGLLIPSGPYQLSDELLLKF